MKKTITIYKPVGLTPLQAIQKFKEKHPEYKKAKIGYAGRLDPLAEGVLLVLVGEENKKIREYLKFDKEYKAEILFGISSDSHDVLGMPKISRNINSSEREDGNDGESKEYSNVETEESQVRDSSRISLTNTSIYNKSCPVTNTSEEIIKIKKKLKNLKGRYEQKIPAFSSYKIKGKPSFYYALHNQEVEEIKKIIEIKNIQINSVYEIGSGKLLREVLRKISLVNGNFRQDEIKNKWKQILENTEDKFLVINVTISCSSGTYIRAIADDIGKEFGGGLLLSLKRTRVGKFENKIYDFFAPYVPSIPNEATATVACTSEGAENK